MQLEVLSPFNRIKIKFYFEDKPRYLAGNVNSLNVGFFKQNLNLLIIL